MCGIFGYVGNKNGVQIALQGLKKMEYRGYDSAGVCTIIDNHLICRKAVGKLEQLQMKVGGQIVSSASVIAHTRWATHGKVSEENAHPVLDHTNSVAVVHNGVIDNYQQLRIALEKEGIVFRSETDTEVIPNVIAREYRGDFLQAVLNAMPKIHGTFAIAILHKNHPHEMIIARQQSPLVIGIGMNETYVASDPNALVSFTKDVVYLKDGDIAKITADSIEIFDSKGCGIFRSQERVSQSVEESVKGQFEHFTLKEIFEQPLSIKNALMNRYKMETGTVHFEELTLSLKDLLSVKRVLIIACGSSYYAGMIGAYLLEEVARIPATVEVSSEFRYRNPIIEEGTLVIAISQSGETADTLAAMREVRAKGAFILAICNVPNSTIAREADSTLFLRAGQEVGVCSTKAFTSSLTVLTLFTLMMARLHHMDVNKEKSFLQAIVSLPDQVEAILQKADAIQAIAKKYASWNDCFFIGRRYMYPTCLEGALKLKEMAYINASGYPAGEMKHGPIALLSPTCPTIALCAESNSYDKVVSNVMEAKARHSPIVAIVYEGDERISSIADAYIEIPRGKDELAPIVSVVVCQLYSYFCAKERGTDIDQPRNLAKSVTVE